MAVMSAQTAQRSRRRMGRTERREALAGYAFVLPWLISLLVFTAYPVLAAFYFSFTDYSILQAPRWIGLDNYRTMFTTDPAFWTAVRNSAYYALISVPLGCWCRSGWPCC